MVVDDDDIIFKGGLLLQGTADGVGNGLGAVEDGNDDRGLDRELLLAEVGRAVVGGVDLGTDGSQVGRGGLLHLHLHLAVARIDIVELLDAGGPRVELLFGVQRLVQMQQLSLTAQEQAQGVEAGILIVGSVGLGESLQQLRLDEPQRAEVEVVADGAELVVDGGMTPAVGIDKGGSRVDGHAEHTLQCTLSQRDGGRLGKQQDIGSLRARRHAFDGTCGGHPFSPGNMPHCPAFAELRHDWRHRLAVEVGEEAINHLSHIPKNFLQKYKLFL